MKKILCTMLYLITVLMVMPLYSQVKFRAENYILFGDYSSKINNSEEIYFDKHGDLYPELQIDNTKLKKAGASLSGLFEGNNTFKESLIAKYKVKKNAGFESVQDEIIKAKAKIINKEYLSGKFSSITFIMVGYNNNYNDASASLDILKKKINKKYPTTMIIKLIWDGTCITIPVDNFRYATANSYNVGLGLRQLLEFINCNNVKLISHSLGANVICETLFNQIEKMTIGDFKNYYEQEYKRKKFKTPRYQQKIVAAMVAPAIPGTSTFNDYLSRSIELNDTDNYKIIIGFNTNDKVLKKFIGIPKLLSSSSLGCLKSEVDKVEHLFNTDYKKSTLIIKDFSSSGSEHSIRNYIESSQYDELLKEVYR